MIIMISLSIGFSIGYLAASLVNAARDYEMPEIEQDGLVRDHASGKRKGWAKDAMRQTVDIDYRKRPEDGLASHPTNTTKW